MRLGVVINPVAGLGGAVGLKGTDGMDTVAEALRRGAVPQAGLRARRALQILAQRCPGTVVLTAPGPLGADWLANISLEVTLLPQKTPRKDNGADTQITVAAMAGQVDLIIFAGGDGTARDVLAAAPDTAMLGIPCGVKMHSGVFALSPANAGHLIADLMQTDASHPSFTEAEVMDIDEAALRAGHIAPHLYGMARIPARPRRMQAAKGRAGARDDQAALALAAAELAKQMPPDTLYIIGPGASAGQVVSALGEMPTLLGVDAVQGGKVVARDAQAAELHALTTQARAVRLVLGVTGQQGFLLGRGNQQIDPGVIRAAGGRDALDILATQAKLNALAQPCLWVDTGCAELDQVLSGYVRVRTGAGEMQMMRIAAA
ncbi:ATP-NAD kinase family protein [Roseicitreum antarcticum]|uniref:Predicted polyphosphate-or ATP-dependent NAD kinase n=1 Tax=Roseicitreum antarcticum TaxID=564137 RepID=A0A1H2YXB6_9RHOB|nr:NAD(+)/NADH kinase [Roseicitreum antarcticum]SDX09731.1 Predicted polyphosphate-or ATP-dependent NAD kinase [Roseicitreum antarcticum]